MSRGVGRIAGLLLGLALLGAGAEDARAQSFYAEDGFIAFTSGATLHTFQGRSQRLTGRVDFADRTVSFYVDLETLDSGNRRRDRDMRQNYLQTRTHPFARFEGRMPEGLTFEALARETPPRETPVRVEGTFTLRGIERPIVVQGTATRVPEGLRVIAQWTLRLGDYGIERPRVLLLEVSEEQTIDLDIVLRPESQR
jgi:polyisoprenoid-binding protein YceI